MCANEQQQKHEIVMGYEKLEVGDG
jgi:hypothetical protein